MQIVKCHILLLLLLLLLLWLLLTIPNAFFPKLRKNNFKIL